MSGIPHDHYEPKTGVEKWIESRLPILGLIHSTLFIPTPKNLNWMWIWGIVLDLLPGDADRHRRRAGHALHPARQRWPSPRSSTSCAT